MNKQNKQHKAVDFQKYLAIQLKSFKFKKHYDEYGKQLEIAYQIAELRKQEWISQIKLAEKVGTT
ncbi:hypothetical protein A3J56_01920 [Candidatus Giovannonibacteria bacterium RIFCSPHIGHO2_02_FULL_46_20]|uniref:HTH cro/C1-type domain-containing protein n=1 Tax=Candidatus Giovannonibacteria bacterium RIFCSPHIGHO2_02_FULL_46_20 TaxID=1798338 RepID=A0A1F5WDM7_9BACT|nr:MAG: hypothetical protein A3J56_01920 [Candidatus Giovannonibacteria bacterium RIFCSPHIGHO2_02_FULL_46_20]